MTEYNQKENFTKAILAGVYETALTDVSEQDFFHSMDELKELARACYFDAAACVTQQLPHRTAGLYLGAGKVEEICELVHEYDASVVILNDTLSPIQIRNLSKEAGVPVLDRTGLILEIFGDRARTREAKLQVELAKLQYMKPRLIGMWEKQNRQGGASGSMSSKGEGETQLEIDRRSIDHRLTELRRELSVVERERATQRKKRKKAQIPLVALVGYTNAGKSTIMNAFVEQYSEDAEIEDRKVFEADMLFATLDTTVRKISAGNGSDFLLSDTVGFIQKLPASLVEAFKSTLEEVKNADLLLHIVDFSDEHYKDHMKTTEETVSELGAGDIPTLFVYNKADLSANGNAYPRAVPDTRDASGRLNKSVVISAREASSVEFLKNTISGILFGDIVECSYFVPFENGADLDGIIKNSQVLSLDYTDKGTAVKVSCHLSDAEKYKKYAVLKN